MWTKSHGYTLGKPISMGFYTSRNKLPYKPWIGQSKILNLFIQVHNLVIYKAQH